MHQRNNKNSGKIWIIIVILILVGIVSIGGIYLWKKKTNKIVYKTKDFQYEIGECDDIGPTSEGSVTIEKLDKSIKFNQLLIINCAANKDNVSLEYKRKDNNLEVNETFNTNMEAECDCGIRIKGIISNLEKGNYKIKFLYGKKFLEEQEFGIK